MRMANLIFYVRHLEHEENVAWNKLVGREDLKRTQTLYVNVINPFANWNKNGKENVREELRFQIGIELQGKWYGSEMENLNLNQLEKKKEGKGIGKEMKS